MYVFPHWLCKVFKSAKRKLILIWMDPCYCVHYISWMKLLNTGSVFVTKWIRQYKHIEGSIYSTEIRCTNCRTYSVAQTEPVFSRFIRCYNRIMLNIIRQKNGTTDVLILLYQQMQRLNTGFVSATE